MSQLRALLDALLASGVSETDAAELLAIKAPSGGSWTVEVLNSGKADETRFTAELGKIFRTPVAPIDAAKIERPLLQLLPGRFVFKHHILPVAAPDENTIVLATYDVLNQTARRHFLRAERFGDRIDGARWHTRRAHFRQPLRARLRLYDRAHDRH